MTSTGGSREHRHLIGMGRRAMLGYGLLAVPFSAVAIALGLFLPINAMGGPEETLAVRTGLWVFGLGLVLVGLTVLVPATVSWWYRVRSSAAYRRDPVAGRVAAQRADRLELRVVAAGLPLGLRTGHGIPEIAERINRLLAWVWGLGVMVAAVAIIGASIG